MKEKYLNLFRVALCAGSVVAVTACGTSEQGVDPAPPPAQDKQEVTREKEISAEPMDHKAQIEFSRKDLAQRLGVELDSVTFSGARPVDWRSGALGCPEPGMNYTQALVPGVLIYLRVGNEAHGYHAKRGGQPFYCPRERAEKPVYGQGVDVT